MQQREGLGRHCVCASFNTYLLSSYCEPWGLLVFNNPESSPLRLHILTWKSLREAIGAKVRSQHASVMLAKDAPGAFPPRNGIWHPANQPGKAQTVLHLIKDAFSTGFYFRANSIGCFVESKKAQLPCFNNMVDSTALIPGDPGLTILRFL